MQRLPFKNHPAPTKFRRLASLAKQREFRRLVVPVTVGLFGLTALVSPQARAQMTEVYKQTAQACRDAAAKATNQADAACYIEYAESNDCLAQGLPNCKVPTCVPGSNPGTAAPANTAPAAPRPNPAPAPVVESPANQLDDAKNSFRESVTDLSGRQIVPTRPDPSQDVAKAQKQIQERFNPAAADLSNQLQLKNLLASGPSAPANAPGAKVTSAPSGSIPQALIFPEPELDLSITLLPKAVEGTDPAVSALIVPVNSVEEQIKKILNALPSESKPSITTRFSPFFWVGKSSAATGELASNQWIKFKRDVGVGRMRDEWYPLAKNAG